MNRRLVGRTVAVAVVVLAAAIGVVAVTRGGSSDDASTTTTTPATHHHDETTTAATVPTSSTRPPPPTDERTAPIGHPPPLPAGAADLHEGVDYQFLTYQPDDHTRPVAYDPCRPIHYVVNERTAPAGAMPILKQAIAEVSRATGLEFIDDGTTTERPVEKRVLYQPERYGKRWAPVLLAWSDQAELPLLTDDSFGSGGSYGVPVDDGARSLYVTGEVAFNGPTIETDAATFAPAQRESRMRAILMHYVAHVVGLTHTGDVRNILYHGHDGRATSWAPGDLAGLAAVGTGRCYPTV
ncbi:peptidase [Aquihabitans sp. McL0605]|uniref:peptidase n=1 Tax=Aquihabitans sp. McL0605 TaxID=3415671 RepID=UPI003CF16DD0